VPQEYGGRKTTRSSGLIRDRQGEHDFTSGAVRAVGELQHAAVGLCDLAAQDQTHVAAATLRSRERQKLLESTSNGLHDAPHDHTSYVGTEAHADCGGAGVGAGWI
jgi:hypothetical protein